MLARGAGIGHAGFPGQVKDMPIGQEPRERLGDGGVQSGHGLRTAEDEEKAVVRAEAEGAARSVAVDPRERADRRAGDEAVVGKRLKGRRKADRHARREAADRARRATRLDVALPDEGRDASGLRGKDEGQSQVAAGGEERHRTQATEQPPGLRNARGKARRVQDGVRRDARGAQRTHDELVVAQLGAHRVIGHDSPFEATDATDVVELNVASRVAERSRDGQRGVHVPAGPAARHQIPHRAWILSVRSRG